MTRIYVGNLPTDIKESELDDLFYKYGRIRDIDIKRPSRPPAFAFISFDDSRDADDAVRGRDGYNFDGYRLRVEVSRGSRGAGDNDRGERRGAAANRRSDYGVLVANLPRGTSWQDLKDLMRRAGDVIYTEVDRNGDGVVEFSNKDDMENSVKTLDDTEYKNKGESSFIRVKLRSGGSGGGSSGGRGRSPSRSRSRDRRRSPSRSRSPSPRRGGDDRSEN